MTEPLLATAYLPPIQYFARLFCAGEVRLEACEHYKKQTYRNRCRILAANGPLDLTVPVRHTGGAADIASLEVSDHNRWREVHWNALVSAYENSPYFEFYADDFRPFYEQTPARLFDLNLGLIRLICTLLDFEPRIVLTHSFELAPADGVEDCRSLISPKTPLAADRRFRPVPYYQVFAHKFGFRSNLSIVDLLFNMGPESRLILRQSLSAC